LYFYKQKVKLHLKAIMKRAALQSSLECGTGECLGYECNFKVSKR